MTMSLKYVKSVQELSPTALILTNSVVVVAVFFVMAERVRTTSSSTICRLSVRKNR